MHLPVSGMLAGGRNRSFGWCRQTVGKIHCVTVAGSPVAIGTRKSSAAFQNSAAVCKLNRRQVGSGRTSFQLGEFFYFD